MPIKSSTRPRQSTWLGVPGTWWEYRATSNRLGERVCATLWAADSIGQPVVHPAGTLLLSHVTGDAWRNPAGFVKYDERVVPNGTMADADAYAAERLA